MRFKTLPPSVRSVPSQPADRPDPQPDRSRRRARDILATLPILLLLPIVLLPFSQASAATGGSLLLSPSELAARPTSGPAWDALVKVAQGSLGTADLTDQNNKHAVRTLGVALVADRTDSATYRSKARAAILAAIGTERVGANNSTLALGRQLGAYVMAADLIGLDGADDARFRSWLGPLRTEVLGGHSIWTSLTITHEKSGNNWGAFAGASRIAASLYLGDTADVARAAAVLRGFLGDRTAWVDPRGLSAAEASWACSTVAFTPINPPCQKNGIDLDGAIVRDVSRGGDLRWPPGSAGFSYEQESLQGLIVQAELLSRAGYPAWSWSDRALRRAANFVTRYNGWNYSSANKHVPWLLNARYGLSLPTQAAGMGRVFGFTDWLYGPVDAQQSTPKATPQPTSQPTSQPIAGSVVVAAPPRVRLVNATWVGRATVPLRVMWGPSGLTYELQEQIDRAAYGGVRLPSGGTVRITRIIRNGHEYRYRVRALSGGGWTKWATGPALALARTGESSTRVRYRGTWRFARSSAYIGGAVRYATARGASATFTFTGRGVAWVGPKGPTRGSARVFIDGVYVRTVGLYARTVSWRQVVFVANWADVGSHTMTIRVVGTAGHPKVAVDAFYVLR